MGAKFWSSELNQMWTHSESDSVCSFSVTDQKPDNYSHGNYAYVCLNQNITF